MIRWKGALSMTEIMASHLAVWKFSISLTCWKPNSQSRLVRSSNTGGAKGMYGINGKCGKKMARFDHMD